MKNKIFDTGYSKIWQDENDIIHCQYYTKLEVSLEIAVSEVELVSKLTNGKKVKTIVDIGGVVSIDKAARDYYSNESGRVYTAVALVANSPVHKVMGNFFLGINKTNFPVKIFTSKNDALEWLNKI